MLTIALAQSWMWMFQGHPDRDILTALKRQTFSSDDELAFSQAVRRAMKEDECDECAAPDEIPWSLAFEKVQKTKPWILSGFESRNNPYMIRLLQGEYELHYMALSHRP